MGLGKTVQTLATLSHSNNSSLIICPSSLVHNWYREAQNFTPHLDIHVIQGNLDKKEVKFMITLKTSGVFLSFLML